MTRSTPPRRATASVTCRDGLTPARVTLAALPPAAKVELDGTLTGAKVAVPAGRHRISLARS